MIRLAEETFEARNDPDQLDVDDQVIRRLQSLHPATLTERIEGDGPVAWILLIPTTRETMELFVNGVIGERELLERTRPGEQAEAIYLCSALVLPEFRKKGYARELTLKVIEAIRRDFPIRYLYVWPFSEQGLRLAQRLAEECRLPLSTRPNDHGSRGSAHPDM
jgi:ribosomal protein S18 acetylase RimI-like enzyme